MNPTADAERQIDCLFVHSPKMNNYYKPLGDFIFINYMPMGVPALADWLDRHGHPTRIVHCGLEWIENKDFSIAEYVRARRPPLVAMTLHWHQQAYDAIENARAIKAALPDCFLVLGGFTAGYYHDEILREYDFVDGIVRGDGEVPMLELVKRVAGGGRDGLAEVPNLTWRQNGQVAANPMSYVGTREILNRMSFANLPLLDHYETYVRYIGLPFIFAKGESKEANFRKYTIRSPLFPLCVGRGCPVDCTYCSGSFSSQEVISRRRHYFYRSYDAVIDTILEARKHGYETMHTCFDPEPRRQTYFARLWRKLRERGIRTEWFFECNALPSREMIDEFARTFPSPNSVIAISAETGSERVRRANRGFYFSNEELMSTLEYIDNKGISLEIFFTYGIPFETESDVWETVRLRTEIARRFQHIRGMRALSIEIEPGAPWQVEPEKYGVRTSLRTFRDYYQAHGNPDEGTYTRLGYYIPNYFADREVDEETFAERLQAIKCKHLCFIHPNPRRYGKPWQGRLLCRVASLARKLAGRR